MNTDGSGKLCDYYLPKCPIASPGLPASLYLPAFLPHSMTDCPNVIHWLTIIARLTD